MYEVTFHSNHITSIQNFCYFWNNIVDIQEKKIEMCWLTLYLGKKKKVTFMTVWTEKGTPLVYTKPLLIRQKRIYASSSYISWLSYIREVCVWTKRNPSKSWLVRGIPRKVDSVCYSIKHYPGNRKSRNEEVTNWITNRILIQTYQPFSHSPT